jgi:hypothetical protein
LCVPRLPSGMCALCASSTPRLRRRNGHACACTRRVQRALLAPLLTAHPAGCCVRALCVRCVIRACVAVAAMRRRAPGSGSTTATICSWTLTRRRVSRAQDSCEQRTSHNAAQLTPRALPCAPLHPAPAQVRFRVAGVRFPARPISTDALRCVRRRCMHVFTLCAVADEDAVTRSDLCPLAHHGAAFCRRWRAACLARRSRPWSWWCALTPPARAHGVALSCASPQSHVRCRRRRGRLRARPCGSSIVQRRPFADSASRSCVVLRHLRCTRASQGDMSCDGGTGMGLLSWWT